MKKLFFIGLITIYSISGQAQNPDFQIQESQVIYQPELDQYIFQISVEGVAGNTTLKPVGQLDGAPVEGYVFPTSLKPEDVGFGDIEGIVALPLISS